MGTIKSWHVVGFILLAGIGIYIFTKNSPRGIVTALESEAQVWRSGKPSAAGATAPIDSLIPGARTGTVGYDSEWQ